MNIQKVLISKVEPWPDNPRGIKTKDYERLKRQILELGVYKPLVCYRENGKFIVLGGNMRIRALKDIGIKEVEVSVVEAKTKAQKIKYALSDNDRAGFYEEDKLAELVYPHIEEIRLEDFKVDLGEPWIDLKRVIERYGPQIDPNAEWEGMPEFESKDVEGASCICIIRFIDEDNIKDFEKRLGYKLQHKGKTYSAWFPNKNFNQLGKGLEFSDES